MSKSFTKKIDEPNLEHSVNYLKQCIEYKDYSELIKVTGGSVCSCYIMYGKKMYNKAILKISSSRESEDNILKEFGHLKSIPKLLWEDGNHSIVEYFYGVQACHAKPTQLQLEQLISDYYFIAKNGYLLEDMSTANILFNELEGFKIIDVGDYYHIYNLKGKEIYDKTESRFWGTLSSCTKEPELQKCKEYAKRILGIEEVFISPDVEFKF